MTPLEVVEVFDPGFNRIASCHAGVPDLVVRQFRAEGGEEAFGHGVIKAISSAAHAGFDFGQGQFFLEFPAGILGAPVGMEDEPWGRIPTEESHAESAEDEFGVEVGFQSPSDDAAAEKVEDDAEIEPAFLGPEVGDIGNPGLVGLLGVEVTFQEVGSHG